MNKIVIANFISKKYTISNTQILFDIPIEFSPVNIIETPVTGIGTPMIKGAVNITPDSKIIFYTANKTTETIRFQCTWESK